jgi:hypothetical protein
MDWLWNLILCSLPAMSWCLPLYPKWNSRPKPSGLVSLALADRVGLQTLQANCPTRTSAKKRSSKRQSLALRQVIRRTPGGKAPSSCQFRFPLGLSIAPRSRWREFAFILHQIQRAVEPGLSLAGTMVDWPRLARGLSESSRCRETQAQKYNNKTS